MARRKRLAVVAGAFAAAAAGALLLSTGPHTATAKPEAHAILIDVRKLWYDEEGKPAKSGADSVRVRVKVDAVEEDGYPVEDPWYYLQYPQGSGQDEISEEGPDGVVGTDDDWTIVLNEECGWGASIWFRNSTDEWPKLRGVEVEELDMPDGYASEVSTDLNLDDDDLGRRDFGYIDVITRRRLDVPVRGARGEARREPDRVHGQRGYARGLPCRGGSRAHAGGIRPHQRARPRNAGRPRRARETRRPVRSRRPRRSRDARCAHRAHRTRNARNAR